MDTAPLDGRQVLLFGRWKSFDMLPGGEPCIVVACYSTFSSSANAVKYWITGLDPTQVYNVEFTHWMPLPEPPND